MVIVDTSVAIKWFLDEPGSDLARKILKKENPLGAPDLLRLEFLNVLVCKKELSEQQIRFFFDLFNQIQIEYFVLPHQAMLKAAHLCRKHQITTYDASFISLAEILHADFVTADEKLLKQVKSLSFVKGLSVLE